MGTGPSNYGVCCRPWYAVYKLESQESRWGNSVWGESSKNLGWSGRSGERGAAGGLLNLEIKLFVCPRAGREREVSAQEDSLALPLPFCFIRHSADWRMPTKTGESRSSLLRPEILMILSSPNTLINSEIMFYWLSGLPLAQSSWCRNIIIRISYLV